MKINNYALDVFTLEVMALTTKKLWGSAEFKKVIICHGNKMTVEETAKEIDAI